MGPSSYTLKKFLFLTDKINMKIILTLTILFSLNTFAQTLETGTLPKPQKEPSKYEKMDSSDEEVFKRDVCRRPIEALETRYSQYSKAQLEKMKSECKY